VGFAPAGSLDTRESFRVGAKPTPVSKDPGALGSRALDVGACSVAKAPGALGSRALPTGALAPVPKRPGLDP
jgi:hypothetical protein